MMSSECGLGVSAQGGLAQSFPFRGIPDAEFPEKREAENKANV